MAKKIQLEADINVRDNAEASIARMRELRKEMRNVAVGSEEFRKLQAEMDDLNDALKTSRTAAGNFVEVLGDVPGPLGDIASQGGMAINTLKSFSSLKFSEIKASIVDLGDDIKTLISGFLRLTGVTQVYTGTVNFLSSSFIKLGIAEGVATTGAQAFGVALAATGIGAAILAVTALYLAYDRLANGIDRAIKAKELENYVFGTSTFKNLELQKRQRELDLMGEENVYKVKKAFLRGDINEKEKALELDLEFAKKRRDGFTLEIQEDGKLRKRRVTSLKEEMTNSESIYNIALKKAESYFKVYNDLQTERERLAKLNILTDLEAVDNKLLGIGITDEEVKTAYDNYVQAIGDAEKFGDEYTRIQQEYIDVGLEIAKIEGDLLDERNRKSEEARKKEIDSINFYDYEKLETMRDWQSQYEELTNKTNESILKAQQEFNQLTQQEYQKSAQYLQDYYNKQYEIINEQFANGELTQEEYNNAIFAKEEEHLNAMLVLQQDYAMSATDIELQKSQRAADIQAQRIQKERELLVNGSQTILGDLSALAAASEGKSEESRKRAFNQQKALAIASTVIGTYDSAQRAYTSQLIPGDPTSPIRATIAAGIAVASGLIRLAVIQKQKFEPNAGGGAEGGAPTPQPSKFKDGGFVRGRLHANGGVMTSAGEIEGGEFVVNRAATAAFLPLLESINSQGIGVNVSRGNLSPTSEMSQPAQAPVIKTYVVASDVTSAQEANKRIQNLARL